MKDVKRINANQKRRVNLLIKTNCANYSAGYCLLLDDLCPQMITFSLNCKYFRESVLQYDKVLHIELMEDIILGQCAICGKSFRPNSNRAKYCPYCAKFVHRKQKALCERIRRAK